MSAHEHVTTHDRTPEDVRRVAAGLDRLGAAERSSADAGFEARLMAAVGRGLAPEPIPFLRARRLPIALGGLLAAAAALALAVVLWNPTTPVPTTPGGNGPIVAVVSFEQQVEDVLALLDGSDTVGDLYLDASLVGDDVSGSWVGTDDATLGSLLEEGTL
jgi:hypothetical protein